MHFAAGQATPWPIARAYSVQKSRPCRDFLLMRIDKLQLVDERMLIDNQSLSINILHLPDGMGSVLRFLPSTSIVK